MCYHFDFKVSIYEKRSNCPYKLSAKSFTLIYYMFSAYTKSGQIKLKYFSCQFILKKSKHEFNLICGSEKRVYIILTANLRNFTKHFHYNI